MNRLSRILLWLFLAVNVTAIVWFWNGISGPLTSQPFSTGLPGIAWGRLAGLLLQFCLLVQMVLIGRIMWVERAFGHVSMNRIHRLIGYSLVILLVAHPLLLSIGYGMLAGQPVAASFTNLLTTREHVFNALLAVLMLFGVVALSVPWARKRLRYHTWHAAHLATYVAILLAFGHQEEAGDFANRELVVYWSILNFGVFGIYFLYRFVRPLWLLWRHRFVIERVVKESPDAYSIYIGGRDIERFSFRAGQFANFSFLSRRMWEPHPFSFSQEPGGSTLRITIKSLGDATADVRQLRVGSSVLIDGPLGAFTSDRARAGKYLLIAGGIGVTPIRALAGELAARHADVVTLYAARTPEHMALAGELKGLTPRMYEFYSQPLSVLPPGAWTGHIDAAAISALVPDVAGRDVFLCGPEPMMDAVTRELVSLGMLKQHIHTERFGY